jgi:hypothetical protein
MDLSVLASAYDAGHRLLRVSGSRRRVASGTCFLSNGFPELPLKGEARLSDVVRRVFCACFRPDLRLYLDNYRT